MRRLTATNALLAVVVLAFGGAGTAYAVAAANSVNSASIIDGSIVTPDLKVGAISGSRLLDHGITSSKIYPNTLTGAEINTKSLVYLGTSKVASIPGTGAWTPVYTEDCAAGDTAISAEIEVYSGMNVSDSRNTTVGALGTGWVFSVNNPTGTLHNATVTPLCLRD